jgi:hypothetical protein
VKTSLGILARTAAAFGSGRNVTRRSRPGNGDSGRLSRNAPGTERCSTIFAKACWQPVYCAASGALAASDESMKAAQLSEFGPSSVLQVVHLPLSHAATGEGLVHVIGAGVNSIVWEPRAGKTKATSQDLAVVPGFDVADAEYARIDASLGAIRPKNIDAITAAAVSLAALTAYPSLFDGGNLRAGQTLLIHGASGGVGHFAVQLAKEAGAKVIGTASALRWI